MKFILDSNKIIFRIEILLHIIIKNYTTNGGKNYICMKHIYFIQKNYFSYFINFFVLYETAYTHLLTSSRLFQRETLSF